MSNSARRHLADLRLADACALEGCPLCRCLRHAADRYLTALLREQVTDLETRRALRASWGFCAAHARALAALPDAAFGAAILGQDLLRIAIRRFGRDGGRPGDGRSWLARLGLARGRRTAIAALYRRRRACAACAEVAAAEARLADTVTALGGDPELRLAYAASDGLCVPHLVLALERAGDAPAGRDLCELTVARWTALHASLDRFLDRHAGGGTGAPSREDAGAWQRALAVLAGTPLVERPGRPTGDSPSVDFFTDTS